ncbi:MAG: hypothetical protein RLO18_10915 [Gimesia chilikensis]
MSQEEETPADDDRLSSEDDFLAAFSSSGQVDEEIDADYERTLEALEAFERDNVIPE